MGFRRRLWVLVLFASVGLAGYGTARYYSVSLVRFVVEQVLVQKLPPGVEPAAAKARFDAMLADLPDKDARLNRLLALSQALEKVQMLTAPELNRLLGKEDASEARNQE